MPMNKEQWLTEMSEELGIDPEDVLEVAGMFFENIDARLSAIESAHGGGDLGELCRLAHGLKGDAANMRFAETSQLARTLEMQCRAGGVVDFEAQLGAIRQAIREQKRILGIAD